MEKLTTWAKKIEFVRQNLDTMTEAELSKHLKVCPAVARRYVCRVQRERGTYLNFSARYREERLAYIRQHKDSLTLQQLADHFGVSTKTATGYLREIGRENGERTYEETDYAKPVYSPFLPASKPQLLDNYGGAF